MPQSNNYLVLTLFTIGALSLLGLSRGESVGSAAPATSSTSVPGPDWNTDACRGDGDCYYHGVSKFLAEKFSKKMTPLQLREKLLENVM